LTQQIRDRANPELSDILPEVLVDHAVDDQVLLRRGKRRRLKRCGHVVVNLGDN
jgi:hypothetical protein